ncbi:hypothetical protein Lesp02_14540 [Lentzea sp. NBRC 105346]|uniref:alpha/beta fold hydrolase n=1 Tax=Lentzea sp. NBRC 105346 TaxID=3032205 RepID=UPI0024A1EBAB|nr:hypothetical protein [Lentzea sp. NBRC 105346]GLZ29264.1 hypothetical protein Lesp02_14540 [Lentzea sp. NBRC 105346]
MSEPRAVVFAPVLPHWDEGRFFTPIIRLLTELGCRVEVFDTLSRLDDSVTGVADLAQRWAAEAQSADLVAGNALGGAVVQALLPSLRPVPVLLVSAPTRTDHVLKSRLSSVAEPAAAGDLTRSLRRLTELVAPEGVEVPKAPAVPTDEVACRRIAGGLRLLFDIDLTAQVSAHAGPLLHFVGERSQLVTSDHVSDAVVVPGAGMRPHYDRPEFVADHLNRFVKENLSR